MKMNAMPRFERSDFKNKPQVLYFIHCKSLSIYWEFEPHSTSSELSREWVSVNLEGVVWLKIHSRNSLEALKGKTFLENISFLHLRTLFVCHVTCSAQFLAHG